MNRPRNITDRAPGTLGARLTEARLEVGLSQPAAAARIKKLAPNQLSEYETGGREPGLARLVELADLYGVTLDWLAGRPAAPMRWRNPTPPPGDDL